VATPFHMSHSCPPLTQKTFFPSRKRVDHRDVRVWQLRWNLFVDSYVKIQKESICYSCIPRLWNLEIDVKTAFININLHEDMYITRCKGFESKESVNKAYKPQTSIYKLKQALNKSLCLR